MKYDIRRLTAVFGYALHGSTDQRNLFIVRRVTPIPHDANPSRRRPPEHPNAPAAVTMVRSRAPRHSSAANQRVMLVGCVMAVPTTAAHAPAAIT